MADIDIEAVLDRLQKAMSGEGRSVEEQAEIRRRSEQFRRMPERRKQERRDLKDTVFFLTYSSSPEAHRRSQEIWKAFNEETDRLEAAGWPGYEETTHG